jgi:hypothetical protein
MLFCQCSIMSSTISLSLILSATITLISIWSTSNIKVVLQITSIIIGTFFTKKSGTMLFQSSALPTTISQCTVLSAKNINFVYQIRELLCQCSISSNVILLKHNINILFYSQLAYSEFIIRNCKIFKIENMNIFWVMTWNISYGIYLKLDKTVLDKMTSWRNDIAS